MTSPSTLVIFRSVKRSNVDIRPCGMFYTVIRMKRFHCIVLCLLTLSGVGAPTVGSINDHAFTYETNLPVAMQSFDNRLSCNICLCTALRSATAYKAINCYRTNFTCVLIPASLNLTNVISLINSTAYMLYPFDLPTVLPDGSMSRSISSTMESTLTSSKSESPTTEQTTQVSPSSARFTSAQSSTSTTTRTSSTSLTTTRCILWPWFC